MLLKSERDMDEVRFEPGALMAHMQEVAREVAGWPDLMKRTFGVTEHIEYRQCSVDSPMSPGWSYAEWLRGWRVVRS